MILLSYDGSGDAQTAVESAARLMPGAEATVLTVWEPFVDVLAHSSAGMGMGWTGGYADSGPIDEANEQASAATASEGAERAGALGLSAKALHVAVTGDVASTILAAAGDVNADAIVMGTRGLSGVKSFLLGSVSHAVVQHAGRPVLIVPSPDLAARRSESSP